MKRIVFTKRNRSGNLLHVETDLGIVNIRVGLHDANGRRVTSVEIIPDVEAGGSTVELDGYSNNRLTETEATQ